MAGEGIEPPPGWQAGVWSAIEKRKEARRRWRNWWLLAPAAAAILLAVLLLQPPGRTQLALAVEIESGAGPVRRGDEAHPGDRLRLRATIGEASNAELRVYRNDRTLVLRCSTEPPCRRGDATLEAEFILPAIGSYQSLLVTSDRPLPEAGVDLDADSSAALAAGAQTTLGEEIEAR